VLAADFQRRTEMILAQPGHPPERALVFFPTLQPAKGEWPGGATTCGIVTRTGPVRRFDYRLLFGRGHRRRIHHV